MDHVPFSFIHETITLLNYSDFDKMRKPIAEFCHVKSAWGAIAFREVNDAPLMSFFMWNDNAKRTTRFAILSNGQQVTLQDAYLPYSRVTYVSLFTFTKAHEALHGKSEFPVSEELNAENVRQICSIFRRNISEAAIQVCCPIEFDEDVLLKLVLSLSRICVVDFHHPHQAFVTAVLKHLRGRGTLTIFGYSGSLEFTEEAFETLREMVSSQRFYDLYVGIKPSSPVSAHTCMSRILDGLESSGIRKNIGIAGSVEYEDRSWKERAAKMVCTLKSLDISLDEGEGVRIYVASPGVLKI